MTCTSLNNSSYRGFSLEGDRIWSRISLEDGCAALPGCRSGLRAPDGLAIDWGERSDTVAVAQH